MDTHEGKIASSKLKIAPARAGDVVACGGAALFGAMVERIRRGVLFLPEPCLNGSILVFREGQSFAGALPVVFYPTGSLAGRPHLA